MLFYLWSFQSEGGELFALSTGRVPPAQDHLVKDWKLLKERIAPEAIAQMTCETPRVVLDNLQTAGYHTFEPKLLRSEWVRPLDA